MKKRLVDLKRKEDQPEVYDNLLSETSSRNALIDALGLPNSLKMTNKEDEEYDKNLPMMMALGSMGSIKKVDGKSLVDLLKDTPKSPFGRVLDISPPKPEGFGKVIQKDIQEEIPKLMDDGARDDVFTAIKKLLQSKGK